MAAMKTSTGRLYILFNACLPQNEKVKKRLNICKITESDSYNELKNYPPFAEQFQRFFSEDKLSGYDNKKLREIVKVIPMIIPFVDLVRRTILYGNAPLLTEKDIPDFTSPDSLRTLAAKMARDSETPNITNITEDNFMAVFSDETVKDPTEVMSTFSPAELKNPTNAIKNALKDSDYCIRYEDIRTIKDSISLRVESASAKIKGLKAEKWKLRRKKWLFICIAALIVSTVNAFELMSISNLALLNLLSTILLILYFFVG